jgi:putative glutathione S-transferase
MLVSGFLAINVLTFAAATLVGVEAFVETGAIVHRKSASYPYGCKDSALKSQSEGGGAKEKEGLDKGFNLLEIGNGIVPQTLLVRSAKASLRFVWQRMMAELAPQDRNGNYVRPKYSYVTDGDNAPLPTEEGRYQLYFGNPCPWCHRAVLAVKMLSLDALTIGMTRLQDNPLKASRGGWIFSAKDPDPMFQSFDLRELYDRLTPGGRYQGRCTAPLLIDKKRRCIISNESSDIVRFLNRVSLRRSSSTGTQAINLYPSELSSEIDSVNDFVYELLNNGVYRCGFATTQSAYDRASADVRSGLERCDAILRSQPYLVGNQFTEADLRLLPTALRFDGAYAPLFRAGGGHARIRNYPNLHAWLVRCWELPGVRESIDLGDACSSYFAQLFPLNPGGIVPSPAVTPEDIGLSNTQ